MTVPSSAPSVAREQVALRRILCGVFGSRTDDEVVRQACALAGADGSVDIVCVDYHRGSDALISTDRAHRAVDGARRLAREAGVPSTGELVEDEDRWHGLESRINGHDVIALAGYARSRGEGVVGDSPGTQALHRAPIPVLLARRSERPFPHRILLATDASPDALLAARYAAAICARHPAAAVTILTAGSTDRERWTASAEIVRSAGVEPTVVLEEGTVREVVTNFAKRSAASLVVLGSGGKTGPRALGSVSEHVAHHVPCSVLVTRHGHGATAG